MITITPGDLQTVRDTETLFAFLHDHLRWPVNPEDPYTYPVDIPGGSRLRASLRQIVPFSSGDPYIIYLLESDAPIKRTELREALRQVRARLRQRGEGSPQVERLVFICASSGYDEVRFVRFVQQEGRQPRIRSFGWERAHVDETRTIREICLPALQVSEDGSKRINWATARWEEAWDVERVTKEFYRELHLAFTELKVTIQGIKGDPQLVTQRIVNRMLFAQFLARKGWLNGKRDYLEDLWEIAETHRHSRSSGVPTRPNYYRDYLWPLFFRALSTPTSQRPAYPDWKECEEALGRVPFLNGGLFSQVDENDDRDALRIPNEGFRRLLDVFRRYNFTITESTPDDEEVAVDPEMLGKVFEELVTERHDTGAYYTPRPIVAFMCREALIVYLSRFDHPDAVRCFVENGHPAQLRDPEGVLQALRAIRVCDHACGSGAYLLGMLQELLRLRQALFAAHVKDHTAIHDRKLEIIQRNLFGADISEFAVEIARLRLWLALVVDDPRDPLNDPRADVSLPNLKMQITVGDSVTASASSHVDVFGEAYREPASKLRALHGEYFEPTREGARSKEDVERDIQETESHIRRLLGSQVPPGAVDWLVRWAHVFAPDSNGNPGGFDVVLTNPPYVRQELLGSEYKAGLLKPVHPETYCGTADLYCYFYSRAVQMLRPGGALAFISSNKWLRAKYGEKLRKFIADTCEVLSITDFGELPVFERAATFPMIFIARKRAPSENGSPSPSRPLFTRVTTLDEPYPDVREIIRRQGEPLPETAINKSVWILTGASEAKRIEKMEKAGVPLGTYVGGRIYRGILTGFNEAFIIDSRKREELIAQDPRSAEIIKPLAVGDDIRRWHIRDRGRWLILTKIGVDMDRYPAVFAHLQQYQQQLERRWDKGNHWWELRACDYYDVFEKPKIVYPVIAKEARFVLDRHGLYTNDKTFLLPLDDLFLLAFLNSSCAWEFARNMCSAFGDAKRGGRLELRRVFMECLPVPDASSGVRSALCAHAQRCLDAKAADPNADVSAWEREIDEIVEGLYGL